MRIRPRNAQVASTLIVVKGPVVATIVGQVERLTFENNETGFRVIRLGDVSGIAGVKSLVAVGILPAVGPGTRVRASGRLENDPRHGERFKVESMLVLEPDTIEGLEKYLGSGVIGGVGPVLAKRIVKYFGLSTLQVLDHSSHRLAEVPGLGKAKVEMIRSSWAEHSQLSNVLLALAQHGASPALAAKIVRHFGAKAHEVVQQNPYRLAIAISGVGFKTADKIARSGGISADHPERAQAGILHVLRELGDSGHCSCSRPTLALRAAEMLKIDTLLIESALDTLWADQLLVVEDEEVSLPHLAAAERSCAARIVALLRAPSQAIVGAAAAMGRFEKSHNLVLDESQRAAVHAVCSEKFLVLTGGPGVGKTTLVRAILEVFIGENLRVALAAPTGRAAKRLSESTGRQAMTLHRLLEVNGRGGGFARNLENPLAVDLLIVDEASMIDVKLAASLLEAIPDAARLVIVGDADQLPSVGPGAVLHDLILSQTVPVVRLETIFRQGNESGIVANSHRILRGLEPVSSESPEGDFFVVPCRDPERAAELIGQLVASRIPQRFSLDPKSEVQVLTPMHRGPAGTLALNQMLQGLLNPKGEELRTPSAVFRAADKVMQLKNDYDKGVFNGDVGEIVQVDSQAIALVVRFEGEEGARLVQYEKAEISNLCLAYATSIHKSQGSEVAAVVIPLLTAHFVMLSRNLLYTAVTRAKKLCVIVADERALSIALGETRREQRQTRLTQRLRDAVHRAPTIEPGL